MEFIVVRHPGTSQYSVGLTRDSKRDLATNAGIVAAYGAVGLMCWKIGKKIADRLENGTD